MHVKDYFILYPEICLFLESFKDMKITLYLRAWQHPLIYPYPEHLKGVVYVMLLGDYPSRCL